MKNVFIYIFLIAFLSSCFKEEKPLEPADRGGVITQSVSTGDDGNYGQQVYFDLNGNRVVKVVDRTSWDLAFTSDPNSNVVRLNGSNKMQASKTGETDFNAVTSFTGLTLTFDWDKASGSEDSLALGDWLIAGVPTNEVFIIDLGEAPDLRLRGFKKLQIQSVSTTSFTIRYANIDGTNDQTLTITKDSDKNHTCFSFAGNGSVVDIEPAANDWDLVFTQYLHTFYDSDPAIYYSVNGVLLNHTKVKALKQLNKDFGSITIDDISAVQLTDKWDEIGYDWKSFEFGSELYQIDFTKSYLIQDRLGFYYKLRFIDFYSDGGVKGFPKFEFEKL